MLSSRQNDELCLLSLRPQKQRWVLGLAARSFTEMSPDFVVPTDWIYKTSTRVHLSRLLPKPGRLDFCDFNKKMHPVVKKILLLFQSLQCDVISQEDVECTICKCKVCRVRKPHYHSYSVLPETLGNKITGACVNCKIHHLLPHSTKP